MEVSSAVDVGTFGGGITSCYSFSVLQLVGALLSSVHLSNFSLPRSCSSDSPLQTEVSRKNKHPCTHNTCWMQTSPRNWKRRSSEWATSSSCFKAYQRALLWQSFVQSITKLTYRLQEKSCAQTSARTEANIREKTYFNVSHTSFLPNRHLMSGHIPVCY